MDRRFHSSMRFGRILLLTAWLAVGVLPFHQCRLSFPGATVIPCSDDCGAGHFDASPGSSDSGPHSDADCLACRMSEGIDTLPVPSGESILLPETASPSFETFRLRPAGDASLLPPSRAPPVR